MKAAKLFVKCLENENVEFIFGIPGEENLDIMDALLDSDIRFITTRHEQGAAYMADVYGRLTGKSGVCLSTLGPGATNLVTGVADANMDNAPLVAITGQAATTRMHKESHQVVDLVSMFKPITKYSTQVLAPETIPEVVRKAFKLAESEKPGAAFIDLPENICEMDTDEQPLPVSANRLTYADRGLTRQAAELVKNAKHPLMLVGNGAVRSKAGKYIEAFVKRHKMPVVNTFMAKGIIPFYNEMAMGTAGLQKGDYENAGFAKADLIICVGFDMVEYHPHLWNPNRKHTIIHIDTQKSEVDSCYIPDVELIGNIGPNLRSLGETIENPIKPTEIEFHLRNAMIDEMYRCKDSEDWPMLPQKIIWDLRTAMGSSDIAISDVGSHKMWMARMFRCDEPNTCIISNGFAGMGIAVPGAIAAKLAYPDKGVVAVSGDAGFMMNSQEIETALRCKTPIVVLIWNDSQYGLIEWKQKLRFGRTAYIDFKNPDFVAYAKSFGAEGVRIESADQLLPALQTALKNPTVTIIDCPVDYSQNYRLTELMGNVLLSE